ncbi:MAG: hypothetical protein BIFFINMI_02444 [Phycisphaerae bacterium]|nr:hypothetical protein [Phycisphaerae bacterium]
MKRKPIVSVGRRGTALIEFTLLLPVLMIILLMMVYFGHSMVRKQNVIVTDRHLTWRYANQLGDPVNSAGQDDLKLNLFDRDVAEVTHDGGHGSPSAASATLVSETNRISSDAGGFADTVINHRFPRSQWLTVWASFLPQTLPMDQFQQAGQEIGDTHVREGLPWRYQNPNANIWEPIRDRWIQSFDTQMTGVGGSGLVGTVRNLYLRHW